MDGYSGQKFREGRDPWHVTRGLRRQAKLLQGTMAADGSLKLSGHRPLYKPIKSPVAVPCGHLSPTSLPVLLSSMWLPSSSVVLPGQAVFLCELEALLPVVVSFQRRCRAWRPSPRGHPRPPESPKSSCPPLCYCPPVLLHVVTLVLPRPESSCPHLCRPISIPLLLLIMRK